MALTPCLSYTAQNTIDVNETDLSVAELLRKLVCIDRDVFLAHNADRAFELARALSFRATMIDVDQRGKDGLLLIQDLRAQFPHVPVIAISRENPV